MKVSHIIGNIVSASWFFGCIGYGAHLMEQATISKPEIAGPLLPLMFVGTLAVVLIGRILLGKIWRLIG